MRSDAKRKQSRKFEANKIGGQSAENYKRYVCIGR